MTHSNPSEPNRWIQDELGIEGALVSAPDVIRGVTRLVAWIDHPSGGIIAECYPGLRARAVDAAPPPDDSTGDPAPTTNHAAAMPIRGELHMTPDEKKVSFYQDPAHTTRAKAAYLRVHPDMSWSRFIGMALMNFVEGLEKRHNAGRPFEVGGTALRPGPRPSL